MSLRTPLENRRYKRYLKVYGSQPLNGLSAIREWTYWKLVKPVSPHNRHHTGHLMLVLKRKCDDIWQGTTNNEIYELWRDICQELDHEYHYLKINFEQMRSVDGYVHMHILVLKKKYQ